MEVVSWPTRVHIVGTVGLQISGRQTARNILGKARILTRVVHERSEGSDENVDHCDADQFRHCTGRQLVYYN